MDKKVTVVGAGNVGATAEEDAALEKSAAAVQELVDTMKKMA